MSHSGIWSVSTLSLFAYKYISASVKRRNYSLTLESLFYLRSSPLIGQTVISAPPYEIPSKPELTLWTDHHTISECVEAIITYLIQNKIF
ncbi:MAG: hypothetical protein K0Q73_1179 [Paenibacillus sp.]|nr:hypothetical protein [Paenibacillus sp.]